MLVIVTSEEYEYMNKKELLSVIARLDKVWLSLLLPTAVVILQYVVSAMSMCCLDIHSW